MTSHNQGNAAVCRSPSYTEPHLRSPKSLRSSQNTHRCFFMQRNQDPERVRDASAHERDCGGSGTYHGPSEPGLQFFHIVSPPASLRRPTHQQKFWGHTWHQLGYWSHWPQTDLWIPLGAWSLFEHRGYNNTGDFHLYKTKYSTKQLPRFLTHSSKVLP